MIILQHLTYIHPDKDLLFDDIQLAAGRGDKAALIGNNGVGKSTLLKIVAGVLAPSAGQVNVSSKPYYVPQVFGQWDGLTVAQALGIDSKLGALNAILAGDTSEANFALLDDDWTVAERCREALEHWGLGDTGMERLLSTLSGGQKTRVFLAGIAIHQPEIVLLDEPSNHLDTGGRGLLYELIDTYPATMMIVSHDRQLLNRLNTVYELSKRGIAVYGGNYDFYAAQKQAELDALEQDVRSQEKALRKAKETERETIERQQKLDARGKRKQEKAGLPTISMNTLRNNAEKSTARIKGVHTGKINAISEALNGLRRELPDIDKMKLDFDHSRLHKGKILVTAQGVNYAMRWKHPLDLQVVSGERIAIKGLNGSGKTTLIRLILGELEPSAGTIARAVNTAVYIDQDYSLIDGRLSVYEQVRQFNRAGLQEHEIKTRLTRFLFSEPYWSKPCHTLSGGERMRLMLCCLTTGRQAPDMIVLDEPTNNLDLQNIGILTAAINEYEGTLIVVSHDLHFLEQTGIQRTIELE